MPNKFTAHHNPPIESVLLRALFVGKEQAPLWDVRHQFNEDGALPDAGFAILLVGVNSMVYHHSTSEDDQGRKSAVISVPSSPFVLVCDAAAIMAKPFGQQASDYFLTKMRQRGLKPCPDCGATGQVSVENKADVAGTRSWLPTIIQCPTCEGQGFIPVRPEPMGPDVPGPTGPAIDHELMDKVWRLKTETGATEVECQIALKTWSGDYDRALKWMDDSRLNFDLKGHALDCPGRPGTKGVCASPCPQFKEQPQ